MENEKVAVKQLVERFDAEELKALGAADTAEALKTAASEMGKTLTEDEANALFAALSASSETGELSDEALETVAGGYFIGIDSTKKGSLGIKLL
ncbi:MAG: hypothetical protein ACI4JZ_08605 [Oscillospiraceae bacterium]